MMRDAPASRNKLGDAAVPTSTEDLPVSVAVVTCMDARLDIAGFLDFRTAHTIRNAGGRVTKDVLRSLAGSCAAGIRRVLIIHHTQCVMAEYTVEQLREFLPSGTVEPADWFIIRDHVAALQEDVRAVRESPLVPAGVDVIGLVYDLGSGGAYHSGGDDSVSIVHEP